MSSGDVERLHVSAAKTDSSQLVPGDRQNRSNAPIAIEDLYPHARGGIGISIAIHADLGHAAIIGGVGNMEPIIGFAKLQFAVGLHAIAVAVMTFAFRSAKPQPIRRKRNSCWAVESSGNDGFFAMGTDEPHLAGIRRSVIWFCHVDVSRVRHSESYTEDSLGNNSDVTLLIQRDNSSLGSFGDIESTIGTEGEFIVAGTDGCKMFC